MSIKGLVESEQTASALNKRLKATLIKQRKEIESEIGKIQFLLSDREQVLKWRNSPASAGRVNRIYTQLNETERLFLEAGDTTAARIFKQRMEKELSGRLTNLKINELEVKLKSAQYQAVAKGDITNSMNSVSTQARLREEYNQARGNGGFLASFGRAQVQDIITLETKAAGSKTLGQYMKKLFTTYEAGLKDVFVKGITRGDSYETMKKNLMQTTNITAGKAELLVTTEANAIFNESVRQTINDNPLVKGYRFRAVLDSKTSELCQAHDGEYIPKDEIQPGINFPPLHPRCRSTVTIVLYGEDERKDTMQRYTKNGQNQWVPVPIGTKYSDFKRTMWQFRTMEPGTRLRNVTLQRPVTIAQDDPRITAVGSTRIVPNVPGSAAMLDNRLGQGVSQAAQLRYDKALSEERIITENMMKLADKQSASLSGLEFSAKTGSSVGDKIERQKAKAVPGITLTDEKIVDEMGDLVRYTVVSKHNEIANVTTSFIDGLEKEGFSVLELDNKYIIEGTAYKGVHLEAVSKGGQKFEIQVHSIDSLAVKSKSHILYEEARKVSTPLARKQELDIEMRKLCDSLPNPQGIENLKSFRKEK